MEDYKKEICASLSKKLAHYKLVKKPLDGGSTSDVFIFNYEKLSQERVVKVLKPKILKIKPFKKLFEREINSLATCGHQNVIKIYDKDFVEYSGGDSGVKMNLPFYIMDYLNGYKDLNKYINETFKKIKIDLLIEIFYQIFEGLKHIHSKNIFHNDIKPSNILISPDNHLVIADFGFAWFIEKDKSGKTIIGGTERYWDPEIYEYIKKYPECSYSDENRILVVIDRKTLINKGRKWDLHATGVAMEEILSIVEKKSKYIQKYDIDYLRRVAERLAKPRENSDSINKVGEAIKVIKKLSRPYGSNPLVPELSIYPVKTLRIPKDISISLTDKILEILGHPLFLRLKKVKQLGLAGSIYFGAQHTRIEHSLGVYQNAVKFIDSLLSSYYDSYFRQIIEIEDIYTLLAAALLHDIGQFPFAHAFEDYYMGEFKHETLTCSLINGSFEKLPDSLKEFNNIKVILKKWGVHASDVCSVLSMDCKPENISNKKCLIFRDMLNSPVDVDKLDYIIRDGIHTGVNYGASIDKNRLIESLIIHPEWRNCLVLLEKGKVVAETMMFARYCMYSEVYWQYNVRAYEAMLSEIIRLVLKKGGKDRDSTIKEMLNFSDEQALNYFHDLGISEITELVDYVKNMEPFKTLISFQNIEEDNASLIWEMLINLRWGIGKTQIPNREEKYNEFIEKLYESLSKIMRGLKRHYLIIDIPNTNRIKTENIQILPHYSDKVTMPISKSSGIWEDTRLNLMNWVQQVRIFVKSEFREKLLKTFKDNRSDMENYITGETHGILKDLLK